eukprot:6062298-Pyramimonas_sp.AAC.1
MAIALMCAEEYDIALREHMPMDMEDGEALETAVQALGEKEKELHEVGDCKTCKNMSALQTQYRAALGFGDEWSDNMQVCNVRRRNTGWGTDKDLPARAG